MWEWFAGWVPQLRAPMKWAARASRLRGKRRKQEEVIGREDGDTYIAVFCDLQICGPLEKRRRHLCYFGNETFPFFTTLFITQFLELCLIIGGVYLGKELSPASTNKRKHQGYLVKDS